MITALAIAIWILVFGKLIMLGMYAVAAWRARCHRRWLDAHGVPFADLNRTLKEIYRGA